jgi:hypothetical protein
MPPWPWKPDKILRLKGFFTQRPFDFYKQFFDFLLNGASNETGKFL